MVIQRVMAIARVTVRALLLHAVQVPRNDVYLYTFAADAYPYAVCFRWQVLVQTVRIQTHIDIFGVARLLDRDQDVNMGA